MGVHFFTFYVFLSALVDTLQRKVPTLLVVTGFIQTPLSSHGYKCSNIFAVLASVWTKVTLLLVTLHISTQDIIVAAVAKGAL